MKTTLEATRRVFACSAALVGVLALGGCAAPPAATTTAQATPAAAESGRVVCRTEAPTGMRIPITTCRKVAEIEKRSDNDREWANSIATEVPDVGRGGR